jgi:hypothetical protein
MLAFMLSSCATDSAPLKKSLQISPNYDQSIKGIHRIGIVSDVVIATSSTVGEENEIIYFLIKESETIESWILESTKKCLEELGYEVTFDGSPFVGGYISSKPFNVAQTRGADIEEKVPPFVTNDLFSTDASYLMALRTVIASVFSSIKAGELEKSSPSDYFLKGERIQDNLNLIAEKTNAQALVVVVGNGAFVPAGRRFAQGFGNFMGSLTIALATGGATGVSVYTSPITINRPYIQTWVGLVDLKNGEVLWANRETVLKNPLNSFVYDEEWSNRIFYYLSEKSRDLK